MIAAQGDQVEMLVHRHVGPARGGQQSHVGRPLDGVQGGHEQGREGPTGLVFPLRRGRVAALWRGLMIGVPLGDATGGRSVAATATAARRRGSRQATIQVRVRRGFVGLEGGRDGGGRLLERTKVILPIVFHGFGHGEMRIWTLE